MKRNDVRPRKRLWRTLDRRRREIGLTAFDIKQLGGRTLFGLSHSDLVGSDHLGDLGQRVVEITRNDCVLGTDDDAGGLEPHLDPMRAIVALCSCTVVRIDVYRVVGTGLQTGLTTNADVRVKLDDTVIALIHRRDGAYPDAGRICTMVAPRDLELTSHVRVRARLDALHPCTVHAERDFVLALARRRAGVTADAPVIPNQKPVVQKRSPFHRTDGLSAERKICRELTCHIKSCQIDNDPCFSRPTVVP